MTQRRTCPIPMMPDFALTGDGNAAPWSAIAWQEMAQVAGDADLPTRCKQGRSATGLYLLVDCVDTRIDCTHTVDGADLFQEDVVEWFLQPDPALPLYVEYEISPLGHHLVLIVPTSGRGFHGWTGWKMEGGRAIRRAVTVRGGQQRPGAAITGWSVEVFLPWDLFRGFANVPPQPDAPWRGNVYRIDRAAKWALAPETGPHFHNVNDFAELRFT